jgi:hypothetical protein
MKHLLVCASSLLIFTFVCQPGSAQVPATNPSSLLNTNPAKTQGASPSAGVPPSIDLKKDAPAWVSNLIALFSLVVSTVNLWVVIHFFFRANVDRSHERDEDRTERNIRIAREVGNFWIQELILKTSNEFLHGFFDKYEQQIEDFHKQCEASGGGVAALAKDAGDLVRDFKTDFHKVDKRVLEPLEWVSPSFGQLRRVLDDIEDLVTEEFGTIRLTVENAQAKVVETPEMRFRNLRKEFFRCMHDCHRDFVGVSMKPDKS